MSSTLETQGPSAVQRRRRSAPRWSTVLPAPLRSVLLQAGEMTLLLTRVVWSAVRYPRGYWADVRDQIFEILKRCWIPLCISTLAFGFSVVGLQAGNLFTLFGAPDRLGSLTVVGSVREFAPWVMGMVVAGVIGTSITADLGARRVREEIDALEVLGMDPVRMLVLPRIVAIVIIAGALDLIALVVGALGVVVAAVPLHGASAGAFTANFYANATVTDLWGSVLKTTIFGLIIGVVCCYKGMTAGGGSIGVGRAVNQAVVTAFAAIWIFNYVFTTILLGLNPDMQVFK